jgi:hypothetical protein
MRSLTLLLPALLATASCVARKPTLPDDYPAPHFHDYPEIPSDTELPLNPSNLSARDAGQDAGQDAAADASAQSVRGDVTCNRVTPPERKPGGRQVFSGPPVTNYIPPEIIMRPVRRRIGCVRACMLQVKPDAVGRVLTEFVVEEDGWVRIARVKENNTGSTELGECIARQFIGLEYPQSPARITVVYPLRIGEAP